jgi:hypothetical protein
MFKAEIHLSARNKGNIERSSIMNRNKIIPILMMAAMLAAVFEARSPRAALAATGTSTLGSGTTLNIGLNTDPVTKITSGVVTLLDESGASQKLTISLESAITLKLVIPNAEMVGKTLVIPDPADPTKELANGTLKSLVFVTDPLTKITTLALVVTEVLPDAVPPAAQTPVDVPVSLDLEQAIALGLVIPDPTMIGTAIVIDPTLIIKSITLVKGTTALDTYFGTALGLTGDELAAYKGAGFGYGEIAQACWMAYNLGGDATLLNQILTAKQSGDFSTIVLPNGSTPTNWGQLRRAVLTDPHQNFGQIMSGHADPLAITPPTGPSTTTMMQGSGNGHGNGNGHEHGKGGNK